MNAKPYLKEVHYNTDLPQETHAYPFSAPAIRSLKSLSFHADVTCFVGENGMGKSTLLEALALAYGCTPEAFPILERASSLHRYLRIGKNHLRPDEIFFHSPESHYRQKADGSTHQSAGEAFMQLVTRRLSGNGLYFFDEPEAGLSPSRQLNALIALHKLVQKGSQVIMATQSPFLLAYPNAKIYKMDGDGIREIWYHNTDHYRTGLEFLKYPEEMLRVVLK